MQFPPGLSEMQSIQQKQQIESAQKFMRSFSKNSRTIKLSQSSNFTSSRKKLSQINDDLIELEQKFTNFENTLKQIKFNNADTHRDDTQNQRYTSKKQQRLKKKPRIQKLQPSGSGNYKKQKIRIDNKIYECKNIPSSYFENLQLLFNKKTGNKIKKINKNKDKDKTTKKQQQPNDTQYQKQGEQQLKLSQLISQTRTRQLRQCKRMMNNQNRTNRYCLCCSHHQSGSPSPNKKQVQNHIRNPRCSRTAQSSRSRNYRMKQINYLIQNRQDSAKTHKYQIFDISKCNTSRIGDWKIKDQRYTKNNNSNNKQNSYQINLRDKSQIAGIRYKNRQYYPIQKKYNNQYKAIQSQNRQNLSKNTIIPNINLIIKSQHIKSSNNYTHNHNPKNHNYNNMIQINYSNTLPINIKQISRQKQQLTTNRIYNQNNRQMENKKQRLQLKSAPNRNTKKYLFRKQSDDTIIHKLQKIQQMSYQNSKLQRQTHNKLINIQNIHIKKQQPIIQNNHNHNQYQLKQQQQLGQMTVPNYPTHQHNINIPIDQIGCQYKQDQLQVKYKQQQYCQQQKQQSQTKQPYPYQQHQQQQQSQQQQSQQDFQQIQQQQQQQQYMKQSQPQLQHQTTQQQQQQLNHQQDNIILNNSINNQQQSSQSTQYLYETQHNHINTNKPSTKQYIQVINNNNNNNENDHENEQPTNMKLQEQYYNNNNITTIKQCIQQHIHSTQYYITNKLLSNTQPQQPIQPILYTNTNTNANANININGMHSTQIQQQYDKNQVQKQAQILKQCQAQQEQQVYDKVRQLHEIVQGNQPQYIIHTHIQQQQQQQQQDDILASTQQVPIQIQTNNNQQNLMVVNQNNIQNTMIISFNKTNPTQIPQSITNNNNQQILQNKNNDINNNIHQQANIQNKPIDNMEQNIKTVQFVQPQHNQNNPKNDRYSNHVDDTIHLLSQNSGSSNKRKLSIQPSIPSSVNLVLKYVQSQGYFHNSIKRRDSIQQQLKNQQNNQELSNSRRSKKSKKAVSSANLIGYTNSQFMIANQDTVMEDTSHFLSTSSVHQYQKQQISDAHSSEKKKSDKKKSNLKQNKKTKDQKSKMRSDIKQINKQCIRMEMGVQCVDKITQFHSQAQILKENLKQQATTCKNCALKGNHIEIIYQKRQQDQIKPIQQIKQSKQQQLSLIKQDIQQQKIIDQDKQHTKINQSDASIQNKQSAQIKKQNLFEQTTKQDINIFKFKKRSYNLGICSRIVCVQQRIKPIRYHHAYSIIINTCKDNSYEAIQTKQESFINIRRTKQLNQQPSDTNRQQKLQQSYKIKDNIHQQPSNTSSSQQKHIKTSTMNTIQNKYAQIYAYIHIHGQQMINPILLQYKPEQTHLYGSIIQQQYQIVQQIFNYMPKNIQFHIDRLFTPNKSAQFWSFNGIKYQLYSIKSKQTWSRISFINYTYALLLKSCHNISDFRCYLKALTGCPILKLQKAKWSKIKNIKKHYNIYGFAIHPSGQVYRIMATQQKQRQLTKQQQVNKNRLQKIIKLRKNNGKCINVSWQKFIKCYKSPFLIGIHHGYYIRHTQINKNNNKEQIFIIDLHFIQNNIRDNSQKIHCILAIQGKTKQEQHQIILTLYQEVQQNKYLNIGSADASFTSMQLKNSRYMLVLQGFSGSTDYQMSMCSSCYVQIRNKRWACNMETVINCQTNNQQLIKCQKL